MNTLSRWELPYKWREASDWTIRWLEDQSGTRRFEASNDKTFRGKALAWLKEQELDPEADNARVFERWKDVAAPMLSTGAVLVLTEAGTVTLVCTSGAEFEDKMRGLVKAARSVLEAEDGQS